MANEINVQPQVLNLELYAGDGFSFKLICTDKNDDPIDIGGAVRAQIRENRITTDLPIVEFAANLVDAYLGIVVLSLTGDQTQDLMTHPSSKPDLFVGVWDVEWTPIESEPRTLCQGSVECISDVTR